MIKLISNLHRIRKLRLGAWHQVVLLGLVFCFVNSVPGYAQLNFHSGFETGPGDGAFVEWSSTTGSPVVRGGEPSDKLNSIIPPEGTGGGCDFSEDGTYLAVAHSTSPFITVYKRSGDTFTKVSALAAPEGAGRGCDFSADGIYLAVAHLNSPSITVYKRSGDTFTKVSALAALEGAGRGCDFSEDGTYLAVTHAIAPYITVYKRSGDTFTKVSALTALEGAGLACDFSEDGTYLAVAHDGSPYITVYKRSGDTFTKVSALTAPEGEGYGCDFSADGVYLAVAHAGSPYITVYSRSGDIFTKVSPLTAPEGTGYGCDFSADGAYLAVAHAGSPYITVYSRSGDTFTKVSALAALANIGGGCDFSADGTYLAVAHYGSPYITVYRRSGDTFTNVSAITAVEGTGRGCDFSEDGTYLAVAHYGSPYITVYKRSGDTFTKVSALTAPEGEGLACDFSEDGTYLAVAHLGSPFITVYKRSGDSFSKVSALVAPEGEGYGCDFSADGAYLAVAHFTSPYITVYRRSGDSFTKVTALTAPEGGGLACDFSEDGTYLAVTHAITPYITVYKRSGDTFTKVSALTAPEGAGNGCNFSADGTYLAVAHYGSPYITVYKRSGDTFTKVSALTAPQGIGRGCDFSEDGTYLAVTHAIAPYITVYKRSGDTFTKVSALAALEGEGNGCNFSADGTYLAVAHYGSPYITVYKTVIPNTGNYTMKPGSAAAGYATATGDPNRVKISIYITSYPNATMIILGDATANTANVRLTSTGYLELYNGGTQKGTTGTTQLSTGQWYDICLSLAPDTAGDPAKVYIDQVEETELSADTDGCTTITEQIGIVLTVPGGMVYFDDIVFNTTSSTDDLGDIRVLGARPNGEGTDKPGGIDEDDWLDPAANVATYDHIDSDPPNTTDYLISDGDASTYRYSVTMEEVGTGNLDDIVAGDNIHAVNFLWYYNTQGGGADDYGIRIYDQGSPTTNDNIDDPKVPTWLKQYYTVCPSDSDAWDTTNFNTIEMGMANVSSGGKDLWWYDAYAMVAYSYDMTLVDLVSFAALGDYGKVWINWKTDSEMNNAGFNIYRSEYRNQGFVKISTELIPGLGSSAIGREYDFWDLDVVDGKTYYYKLEDVEFGGRKKMHGPVAAHPGLDSDGDVMTDDWENYYGLNAHDADDAALDPDGDGLANLEEFINKQDPRVNDLAGAGGKYGEDSEDGVRIIHSDDFGVVLELSTSSFDIENKQVGEEIYQTVELAYPHGQTEQVGQPQVPVKGVLLGMPFNAAVAVNILDCEQETYSGYNLYPVPRIHQQRGPPGKGRRKEDNLFGPLTYEFVKDADTYSEDRFYPDCLAEVTRAGALRRQDVAKLNIYPVQFNPGTGQLRLCKKIRIEVEFDRQAQLNWGGLEQQPVAFEKLYKGLLRNYRDVKWWPRHPKKRFPKQAAFLRHPAYKIAVNQEGIYRISWEDLKSAGLSPNRLNPKKIKLYNRAREVPIDVHGKKNGRFNRGDYIEFYAERLYNRYTDTNIYWLVTEGEQGRRMSARPTCGGRTQTPTTFLSEVDYEKDEAYWMDIPDRGYVDDHWFFADTLRAPCSVDFTVSLTGLADVDEEATIKIALQGVSYGFVGPDHHLCIYLNGQIIDDTTWEGNIEYIRELAVPQSYLAEGDNIVTLELPGDTGAKVDKILVNWFEISYQRKFEAQNDYLKFEYQGRGRYLFKISNFTTDELQVFDITDPNNAERIECFEVEEDTEGYTASFKQLFEKNEKREYFVLSSSALKSPISIVRDGPSNLRLKRNQADYIIITHEDFYEGTLPLARHRTAGGLRVEVVQVEDIYDEFNYGIFSPQAIKDFLEFTYTEWQEPAPSYVLLVGDGTYDYRDDEGLGGKNFVPTYMLHSLGFGETGCDNWFVCLDGEDDILPDMFIGRLPVYTVEQLNTIVDKIINYESLPFDDWARKITFVADNLEGRFVNMSEAVAGYLPAGYQTNKIYLDNYAQPGDCRQDIIEAFNEGSLIVNYVGHASPTRWAHESILTLSDIPSLTNLDKLAFISIMSCANGYFIFPSGFFNCMAEEFLYSPSGGGVAVLAPTSVSYPHIQQSLDKGLFESIFVQGNFLVGPATTQGRLKVFENAGAGGENVIQTFPLFGDPALELKR